MIILVFICTLAAQIAYTSNILPLKIVVTAALVIYGIRLDTEGLLYLLLLVMPANKIFGFGDVSVNVILVVLFFLWYVMIKGRKIPTFLVSFAIFYMLYSFAFVFYYESYDEVLTTFKTICSISFLYIALTDDKIEMPKLLKNSAIFSCLGLGLNAAAVIFVRGFSADSRLSFSNKSHANVLANVCTFCLALVVILYNNKNIKHIKLAYLFMFMAAFVGIQTHSRSFYIAFVIIMLWMVIPTKKADLSRKAVALLVIIVLIAGAVYLYLYSDSGIAEVLRNGINRVLYPSHNDISNGRTELWGQYIDAWKNNPGKFYLGVGNDYTRLGVIALAHNMMFETLSAWGLLGTIGIIAFYVCCLISIARKLKKRYVFSGVYNLLPLLIVISSGMFSHTFIAHNTTMMIFLSVACMYYVPIDSNKGHLIAKKKQNSPQN